MWAERTKSAADYTAIRTRSFLLKTRRASSAVFGQWVGTRFPAGGWADGTTLVRSSSFPRYASPVFLSCRVDQRSSCPSLNNRPY